MRNLTAFIIGVLPLALNLIVPLQGLAGKTDLAQQKEALELIDEYADRICTDIAPEGSSDALELSGKAKVELNKLIKKIADMGIEGAAKYRKNKWEGILQEDLAGVLMERIRCKGMVFDKLSDKLITPAGADDGPDTSEQSEIPPKPTPPPTVRDASLWIIDTAGVCRDDNGYYPRWSPRKWRLAQCASECSRSLRCQAFAMSKTEAYCQLIGTNGEKDASKPGTRITRGDSSQPGYSCYLKKIRDLSLWTIDATGVCRDDHGQYPRWSANAWSIEQCEAACKKDSNCQGFAMSKTRNYCQLFSRGGAKAASRPGTRITRGDGRQPDYTCYIKKINYLPLWTIDATGVCRDDQGDHPRWSAHKWGIERCEQACKSNRNCQGFAMSKYDHYCQLLGPDGDYKASRPGTRITRGDSVHPQFTCYVKRSTR